MPRDRNGPAKIADLKSPIGYAPPGSVVTSTIVPVAGDSSANY